MTTVQFSIDPAACVHFRHAAAECRRCADVCPANAVEFSETQPVIREDRCTKCGACSAVCPQEALRPAPNLPSDGTVVIGCGKTAGLPEGAVKLPCLQALNARRLLLLTQPEKRTLKIICGDCAHCARHAAKADFARTLADWKAVLEKAGVTADITVTVSPAETVSDRRRFFSGLIKKAETAAAAPAVHSFEKRYFCNPLTDTPAPKVPAERLRLLKILPQLPEQLRANLPVFFYRPAIDTDRCSGCKLCAVSCPTGALRKIPDNDETLNCLPGLCTGCGLCRDVCFNKAVTVAPVSSELSALRPETQALKPAPEDNETLWEDRLQAMMPDVPIYRT